MIDLQIQSKYFASHVLFERFQLQLERGELLCLLGPSGCGKTTLLNIIAGLDRDYEGSLITQELCISYMFQEPCLLPWRTVRQNLELVLDPKDYFKIKPLLAELGLEAWMDLYPKTLSLGMARRVALARSLIVEPDLILMDEPFVSLDPHTAEELHALIKSVRQRRPQTSIVLVTHDLQEAVFFADRILMLGDRPTRVLSEHRPGELTGNEEGAAVMVRTLKGAYREFESS
ncbi:ABC transporter ATP-binding protein [Neptunomonas antarctica]|uniref:NitT/TauT family transport system ATP-binding protein n=1 Tax=Neptunomonas antarctica TaxID=619304 RepID=A0A1N7N6U1_9GAMM|nr:ABC transporter ATP-binding protein [Neptunomonas antarctica]SIS94107.1 NitT/TauT family transport system ATP-binding protein [Neptunomonas antarctica]